LNSTLGISDSSASVASRLPNSNPSLVESGSWLSSSMNCSMTPILVEITSAVLWDN